MTVFDVMVTGGRIVDGSGVRAADIAVSAGRIEAIGDLGGIRDKDSADAAQTVDAAGRLVLPGLIDTHSHADAAILDPAVQRALLRQGVTSVVLGQDGLSYAPSDAAALAFVTRYFAAINGAHPGLDPGGASVAELRATWHRRTALNTAYLVPHGTLRFPGLSPDDMVAAVERAIEDGAVGLSSGLEYVPGRYADADELAALCRPVAAAGLPYVTHMRGYGTAAPTGFAEARAIGAASGVAVHVSHYHGPAELLTSLVDDALASGMDVTFDSYPYRRSNTILAMAALPRWLDDTDLDRVVAQLAQPDVRARVLAGLNHDLLSRTTVAWAPGAEWAQGLTLTAAADRHGTGVGEFLIDLLEQTGLAASAVIEQPPTTDASSLRALLRHGVHMGGSDGIYVGGHPHPRGWGTFARYLGRHTRELSDWTWPQAVEHLSARPAQRFGLTDRGRIAVGGAADLIVVDPDRVNDRASYAEPRAEAAGVDDVLVNGVVVLSCGELTGRLAGEALTPYPGR
jgi:N-acyl-D-amino-acid deacylase